MTAQHSTWIDRGLLVARIALGIVFVMHGGQKLVVFGHAGVTAGFASLGIPLPALSAAVVTFVELVGGLALLAGALTRVWALLIAATMTVATLTAHLAAGFFLPSGYEFTLTLGLFSVALAMTGAGRYSVDALVTRRWSQTRTAAPAYRRAA